MLDIRGLSTSDKINTLITDVKLKHNITNQSGFLGQIDNIIPDNILYDIFEKIENRIYYISDAPRFEITNNRKISTYEVLSFQGSIDLIAKIVTIDNSKKYFIFYNIKPSFNGLYHLRGIFIDDPSVIREDKINKILNE